MISIETGVVNKILWEREGLQCLEVSREGKKEKALNYTAFTGTLREKQEVYLNTTAVKLGLGSGGFHYVLFNPEIKKTVLSPGGHIIKLRYTPLQFKVQVYEEILAAQNTGKALKKYPGLNGAPVVIGELHSMVAPFVFLFKKKHPQKKIVYVMTDSASLPLQLSDTIAALKKENLLAGTVTCGHAFGGDVETVNVFTALMAAKEQLAADVIILAPGPGVVGTGTRYGFSGIEQGEHIDRVRKFKGVPVFIPRLSFADKRSRHYGLSHHSITSLLEIASFAAYLPIPVLNKTRLQFLLHQVKSFGLSARHNTVMIKCPPLKDLFQDNHTLLQTMGRGLREDPCFFTGVAAAALFTAKLVAGRPGKK